MVTQAINYLQNLNIDLSKSKYNWFKKKKKQKISKYLHILKIKWSAVQKISVPCDHYDYSLGNNKIFQKYT